MRMSIKTWAFGVVITIMGGVNAGAVFSLLDSRFMAAMLAGSGFVIVGGYLALLVWSAKCPYKWFTFYTSHIHLLAVSFPMIVKRVLNPDVPFEDLYIIGLAGPDFHQLSTHFYQILLLLVVVDTVRFYYQGKSQVFGKPQT